MCCVDYIGKKATKGGEPPSRTIVQGIECHQQCEQSQPPYNTSINFVYPRPARIMHSSLTYFRFAPRLSDSLVIFDHLISGPGYANLNKYPLYLSNLNNEETGVSLAGTKD